MPARTAPVKAKSSTELDRTAILKDMRREIVAGAPEHTLRYAMVLAEFEVNARRTFGTFPRLSRNNRLLLESQRRRSGESWKWLLAGERQWEQLGRVVRKEAKAKTIWLPKVVKKDPATLKPDEKDEYCAGFIARPVYFDYTDTVSTDPDYAEPNWDVPLGTGDRSTLMALAAVAQGEGLTVSFEDWGSKNENGVLRSDGTLVVDDSLPLGNQVKTLAHELGHHFLSHLARLAPLTGEEKESARALCEQEAALVELLVMKMLGLDEAVGNDVTSSVGAYLRNWMTTEGTLVDGHKKRMELLDERLDPALEAAGKIVERYISVTETSEAS